MNEDDEIINVAVPRRYHKLIIQTLAQAMTEQDQLFSPTPKHQPASSASRSGTLHLQTRRGIGWTKENLQRLYNGIRSAAPIKMLDMTAANPETPIYFHDVCDVLSQPIRTTRAQIGTLTKIIKRDFEVDYDDANWPVTIRWDKDNGKMFYKMDKEIAQAWIDIKR